MEILLLEVIFPNQTSTESRRAAGCSLNGDLRMILATLCFQFIFPPHNSVSLAAFPPGWNVLMLPPQGLESTFTESKFSLKTAWD